MNVPAHICKRISKKGENPICRGKCTHCPCVGIVRGVYSVLGGNPKHDVTLSELPELVGALLKANGDRVWLIFSAGGEIVEGEGFDDGCGHTQMAFSRKLPEGFMDTDDSQL